jgi:regulator of RNase E activity RraA
MAMLADQQREILKSVTTATITTLLLKHRIRRTWMHGPKPLLAGQGRIVGEAFTLRFIPMREDLATPQSWAGPRSTRAAIEEMTPGGVAVVDAAGLTEAGIFGDILVERMMQRGVMALITDGVVRDGAGVAEVGLPVWCAGTAAPPSIAGLTFVGWQEPIGCGGVAVFPGDVIVADGDGAVVIPPTLVDHVCAAGPEQEQLEGWLHGEVRNGASLPGLYPPNDETRARYEAWKTATGKASPTPR